MKITFVSPTLNLAGGTRVIAIYAELLQKRGHDVVVVSPRAVAPRSLVDRLLLRPIVPLPSASHFDGSPVRQVLAEHRSVRDAHVDDADVVIATWWETAEWVSRLRSAAGAKVYFIQHHETHDYLPVARVDATYRLPLHKIVIARWLADVMKEKYGDHDVDLVPNSVAHEQFFAPLRAKQDRPTVGLLFSTIYWKRFWLALEALRKVHERLPALQVLCFGAEQPEGPLPEFVKFFFNPPQASLRDIYSHCDVWLTASSTEGFNLPAMEAMACRTPVVATRTGWPSEAVKTGINGACVDIDDVDALALHTERVLLLPDRQWREMSAQAFDTVRGSSWERSTQLFEQALERAVQARRSPAS